MKITDFDLAQTLECGQCFNFEKISDNEYVVAAMGRVLHVKQEGSELSFLNASEEDIRNIWVPYFDLDRDYSEIKNELVKAEPRLKPIIEKCSGIRILNQDFTETLISFIISQNKNIPQIKKIVRAICDGFGREAEMEYHVFPSLCELANMTEQDFRDLKTGFRAPYIMNAIEFLKKTDGESMKAMTFAQAKEALTSIKGVGDKVANCVLLFSLGFRSAFPVDVWIKRIMEEMYFGCDTPKKEIESFAAERFGKWGGYAQQYLFMYAREKS